MIFRRLAYTIDLSILCIDIERIDRIVQLILHFQFTIPREDKQSGTRTVIVRIIQEITVIQDKKLVANRAR